MKTFFWIVTLVAACNYFRATSTLNHIGEDKAFQLLLEQKRENDHEIDKLVDHLLPVSVAISNSITTIASLDQKLETLAIEGDQLQLSGVKLKAEIEARLSLTGLIGTLGKSVFDTISLGEFAEQGPMTESIKYQQWVQDMSKSEAVGQERARQIVRDFQILDSARANEAAKLKTLAAQHTELAKPYNDELRDTDSDLSFKLQPFQDSLAAYQKKRTWWTFVFWPALLLALILGRAKNSSPPATSNVAPSPSEPTDANPVTPTTASKLPAREIGAALFCYAAMGCGAVWLWYVFKPGASDASKAQWFSWASIMGCGWFLLSDGWVLFNKRERKARPFTSVVSALLLIFVAALLVMVVVVVVSKFFHPQT